MSSVAGDLGATLLGAEERSEGLERTAMIAVVAYFHPAMSRDGRCRLRKQEILRGPVHAFLQLLFRGCSH